MQLRLIHSQCKKAQKLISNYASSEEIFIIASFAAPHPPRCERPIPPFVFSRAESRKRVPTYRRAFSGTLNAILRNNQVYFEDARPLCHLRRPKHCPFFCLHILSIMSSPQPSSLEITNFNSFTILNDSHSKFIIPAQHLKELPTFPRLPNEIALKIWKCALQSHRLIGIKILAKYNDNLPSVATSEMPYTRTNSLGNKISGKRYHLSITTDHRPSPLLQVCHQSRQATLEVYRIRIPIDFHTYGEERCIYLSPELDFWHIQAEGSPDIQADFFHDAKAYDPAGLGIVNLVIGNNLLDPSEDLLPMDHSSLSTPALLAFKTMLKNLQRLFFFHPCRGGNRISYNCFNMRKVRYNRSFPIQSFAESFDLIETEPRPIDGDLDELSVGHDPRALLFLWQKMEKEFQIFRSQPLDIRFIITAPTSKEDKLDIHCRDGANRYLEYEKELWCSGWAEDGTFTRWFRTNPETAESVRKASIPAIGFWIFLAAAFGNMTDDMPEDLSPIVDHIYWDFRTVVDLESVSASVHHKVSVALPSTAESAPTSTLSTAIPTAPPPTEGSSNILLDSTSSVPIPAAPSSVESAPTSTPDSTSSTPTPAALSSTAPNAPPSTTAPDPASTTGLPPIVTFVSVPNPTLTPSYTPIQALLTCTPVNDAHWMRPSIISAAVPIYCADAAKQGVQDPDSGSLIRTYNQGIADKVSISTEWLSGLIFVLGGNYYNANMSRVMDGCSGDSGNNPMGWKFPGEVMAGPVGYRINKGASKYVPGICSFHLTEIETFSGLDALGFSRTWTFSFNVEAKDGAGNTIGGNGAGTDPTVVGDKNPYNLSVFYDNLQITPESQGGNYI
ncbi:hypothetical protein G7Y89_g3977 [Cudoniella acicularis]|uniref:2EXR domain-containing protein n=1 Tax=Cudoniella acicularis TaxID=354080 RepID=A0A8H4W538_9HELO|nr:hypothetical protein G7Y89_g3977 [Cudoniella acicularis]